MKEKIESEELQISQVPQVSQEDLDREWIDGVNLYPDMAPVSEEELLRLLDDGFGFQRPEQGEGEPPVERPSSPTYSDNSEETQALIHAMMFDLEPEPPAKKRKTLPVPSARIIEEQVVGPVTTSNNSTGPSNQPESSNPITPIPTLKDANNGGLSGGSSNRPESDGSITPISNPNDSDNGSLFGDVDDSDSFFAIDDDTTAMEPDFASATNTNVLIEGTNSSLPIQDLAGSHPTNEAWMYPTPRSSPSNDVPLTSVERNIPLVRDMNSLSRQIRHTTAVPYFSKKRTIDYAKEHGFMDTTKSFNPKLPTIYLTSKNPGQSGKNPIDLAFLPPVEPQTGNQFQSPYRPSRTQAQPQHRPQFQPPPTQPQAQSQYQPQFQPRYQTPQPQAQPQHQSPIASLSPHLLEVLRAKLAATCPDQHAVPRDLVSLFENLEQKFQTDLNFRHSVLVWVICKMKDKAEAKVAVQVQDTTMKRANKKIQELTNEKDLMKDENDMLKKTMTDMASYIGYLESVNRNLPKTWGQ